MNIRTLKIFIAGLAAVVAVCSCTKEETQEYVYGNSPDIPSTTYDEAYYASNATLTCNDPAYTAADGGGTITFGSEGGIVVVGVDCDVEWAAECSASGLFSTSYDIEAGTLSVTAGRNLDTEEKTASVSMATAASKIEFAVITLVQESYLTPTIHVGQTEWRAPAKGALTAEIEVETSIGSFDVVNESDWLTVEATATGVSVTAAENESAEERTASFTITTGDDINSASAAVTVTQDAAAYIALGSEAAVFDYAGGTAACTVESNYDWDFTCDNSDGWFSVSSDADGITITVEENPGEDSRNAIVTFTAGDGAENVAQVNLTVVQTGYSPDALVLTYTITTAGTTVTLPLVEYETGDLDCDVDWGDGSEVQTVTEKQPTHTYSSVGTYDVTISGTVKALSHSGTGVGSTKPNTVLTAVKSWGNTGLVSLNHAFYYCEGLTSIPADTDGSFADVTDGSYAFYYCNALESLPDGLFTYATNLTTLARAFYHCDALTAIPTGLLDNCTELTTLSYAFYYCTGLTEIPAGLFSKLTKVTDFSYLFSNCSNMAGDIPSGYFDTCPDVTTFAYVFNNCKKITSIPEGLFAKHTKVESYAYAFYYTAITTIPEDIFANSPDVTDFEGVIGYCTSLTEVPGKLFAGNTKVTSFKFAFRSLTVDTLPEELFANCPEVTSFNQAFYAAKFTTLPAGLFDHNLKVDNCSSAFYLCSSLTSESPYTTLSDGTKVHLYERADHTSDMGCVAPTTYSKCFGSCTKMADYSSVPSGWK